MKDGQENPVTRKIVPATAQIMVYVTMVFVIVKEVGLDRNVSSINVLISVTIEDYAYLMETVTV
jgi:hypothetical protein